MTCIPRDEGNFSNLMYVSGRLASVTCDAPAANFVLFCNFYRNLEAVVLTIIGNYILIL